MDSHRLEEQSFFAAAAVDFRCRQERGSEYTYAIRILRKYLSRAANKTRRRGRSKLLTVQWLNAESGDFSTFRSEENRQSEEERQLLHAH